MKPSPFDDVRPRFAAMSMAALFMGLASQTQGAEVQVGRYSMLPAMPTPAQAELLSTLVTLAFPARIQTVGQALRYLLQRSGYRLAAAAVMGGETRELLRLPLPSVHRSLGPISLTQALQTLAGPAFRLVQDPQHRLVAFESCKSLDHVTPTFTQAANREDRLDGD